MLRPYRAPQRLLRSPQHARQLVTHQLHHLLARAHRLERYRTHRPSVHPLDESVRDFDADVGIQQVAPDLPERLVHVLLGEHAPTRNPLQDGGELLRKGRKHKPRKLVSELAESKWGNYLRGGITGPPG